MTDPWDDARQAFADAADWFVATTATVGDRWEQPGWGSGTSVRSSGTPAVRC